ncbi:MAG: hypothetical protein RLO80_12270 [Hyphomonas sp.]
MTALRTALIAAASAFALAACTTETAPEPADLAAEQPVEVTVPETAEETVTIEEEVAEEAVPVEETDACDVLESSGWEAWINKMPGPGATPTIHVIGKVTVRTGGYTFEWQEGPLDRSAMPALRLKLVPVAPTDMAMQALTTEDVKYEAPALATGYRSVIIGCGSETLAEITEITVAQ